MPLYPDTLSTGTNVVPISYLTYCNIPLLQSVPAHRTSGTHQFPYTGQSLVGIRVTPPDPRILDKVSSIRGFCLEYQTFFPVYGDPVYGDLVYEPIFSRYMGIGCPVYESSYCLFRIPEIRHTGTNCILLSSVHTFVKGYLLLLYCPLLLSVPIT